MNEITIKVGGMSCEGCEKRIQNALREIDGVVAVKADHVLGEVKVTMSREIDVNSIKDAIEMLGFDIIE